MSGLEVIKVERQEQDYAKRAEEKNMGTECKFPLIW